MNVPIERVKFVCHDKQDANTFAVVVQLPVAESAGLGYRLYCFQAETKTVSLLGSFALRWSQSKVGGGGGGGGGGRLEGIS